MKICFLSDTYPPDVGGLAISARRNARNLASSGHEVHVIAPMASQRPGSRSTEADGPLTVHRVGTHPELRETLTEWLNLAIELDQAHDFSLFHGHFISYAGYVAALSARNCSKPSVVSARGNDIEVMPFDYRRAHFVHKALDWADAIVAVTEDLRRKTTALSGRGDVHLVHNGVDADRFSPQQPDPELRAALALDNRPVVGFIGEARAKKGLARLLRVFPRVYGAVPCQLLLVGGVRDKDQALVDFFQEQHPNLPLCLVPPTPNEEMPRYYALCDVVVLPSLWDGLPNTLLEAMACGRAVLASAVGGMLDVVTDGADGILLSRDDDAWVDALGRALSNAGQRQQLGAAARRTAIERFSTRRELDALFAVYEQVLTRAGDRTPPAAVPRPAAT